MTRIDTRGTRSDFGLYRLIETRHGRFLANPADTYIGRSMIMFGEFSQLEIALLTQIVRPGQTVVEVGANYGTHTLPLSTMVGTAGRIHAFEPQPMVFQALCANLALNGRQNTYTYNAALGSAARELCFPDIDYSREGNFGGLSMEALPETAKGQKVPIKRLDAFGLGTLHLLKIDAEGAEQAVLAGAEETLRRCRPAIYLENDRPDRSAALIDHLLERDYALWWHLPPLFNPSNWTGRTDNPWPGVVSINMLCLPTERPANISGLRPVKAPDDRP